MTKPLRLAAIYTIVSFCACLVWAFGHFAYFGFKWFSSYSLNTQEASTYLDIRKDKLSEGKVLRFRAIKADPSKSVYFGHVWIVWQSPPPLANGAIASGYYPKNNLQALEKLFSSFISPMALFERNTSVLGEMKDDSKLPFDWEMVVRIDEDSYWRAALVDNYWRVQNRYSLRNAIGANTNNCRDYVFQIAEAIGLNTDAYRWAEFPPETFVRFKKLNERMFANQKILLTVAN